MNIEILKSKLQEIANRGSWDDEIDGFESIVDDFAGGNIDDAYEGGKRAGEVALARELCSIMGWS